MELEYREPDGSAHKIVLERKGDLWSARVGDREHAVEVLRVEDGWMALRIGNRPMVFHHARTREGLEIAWQGYRYCLLDVAAEEITGARGAQKAGDGRIRTPMPGKIVEVHVSAGDEVAVGQPLLILESMKMQNDVVADVAGRVAQVCRAVGDNVEYGDLLIEIKPDGDGSADSEAPAAGSAGATGAAAGGGARGRS